MKKLSILVVLLSLASLSFGQRLITGEKQVNAGFGFNSGHWEIPVYVGVEYGVHPDITVGASLGFATSDHTYNGYKNEGNWFSIGARSDYHFNTILEIPNQWDVYAGLKLTYDNFSYDNNWPDGKNYDYDDSGINLAGQIGARYYFNERIAINLEFGGSEIASGGRIGISYKF